MYTPTHKHCHNKERGAVMLVTMLLLLGASIVVVVGSLSLVKNQVRVLTEHTFGKLTYAHAEGALEDVVYRHMHGMNVSSTETLTNNDISATTLSTATLDGYDVEVTGTIANRSRSLGAELWVGYGAAFSFGVQTHNGGIEMENNSSVSGNVYSNGPVIGHGLNKVYGTVVSAGPSGYIEEIHATGTAYAHEIADSYIEGDAHYQVVDVGTVVDGTQYPGATDQATSSMPITDTVLDEWALYASSTDVMEAECVAAGGTLVIDTDTTLGPVKIPCDVKFEKFPEITIAGVVWIEGDLSFKQGPEFVIDAAIGNMSVPFIVDDPTDRLTSGRTTIENSGTWSGNGNRSYILMISRNESAEQGGGETAIRIKNSAGGDLLVYSNHGEIAMENNTDLSMVTAWRVRLQNFTEVHYDTGIASTLFEAGPGGGYTIHAWGETE